MHYRGKVWCVKVPTGVFVARHKGQAFLTGNTGFPKSRALLKPASEHWILIKAPGELRELRIEENRIAAPLEDIKPFGSPKKSVGGIANGTDADREQFVPSEAGRWPANFALSHSDECGEACADDCPVKMLDGQSEERGMHSAGGARKYETDRLSNGATTILAGTSVRKQERKGDSGGASRFFYVAKPSTRERSAGLSDGARNTHTTVKSIALMRHLISLIAAPSATILDPFAGSGSTGIAALKNGCHFVGIEREAEYVEIARQRVYSSLL